MGRRFIRAWNRMFQFASVNEFERRMRIWHIRLAQSWEREPWIQSVSRHMAAGRSHSHFLRRAARFLAASTSEPKVLRADGRPQTKEQAAKNQILALARELAEICN